MISLAKFLAAALRYDYWSLRCCGECRRAVVRYWLLFHWVRDLPKV